MTDTAGDGRIFELQRLFELALARQGFAQAEAYLAEARSVNAGHPWLAAAFISLNLRRKRWRKAFQGYARSLDANPSEEAKLWSLLSEDPHTRGQVGFATTAERIGLYVNVIAAVAVGIGVAAFSAFGWRGLVNAAIALLVATLTVEFSYRCYLRRRYGIKGERHAYPDKLMPSEFIAVTNIDARTYHPVRGYDLVPNTTFVHVGLRDGRVFEASTCTTDRNGNIGFTDEAPDDHALNILVVGDSFTSYAGNGSTVDGLEGVEWPFFFKAGLADAGFANTRIMNYGRTGHGLLQMADTAADLIERCKPDVVILAFNSFDIRRPRFWQQSHTSGGFVRSMVTHTEGGNVAIDLCFDQHLVDRRVTLEWAQERLKQQDTDALIGELTRRYESLRRRTSLRAIDLLAVDCLYSWDCVFFGTPFIAVKERTVRSGILKLSDDAFANDRRFSDAIARIKKSGAEFVLLQLPLLEELERGYYLTEAMNPGRYMESLKELTGEQIWGSVPKYDRAFLWRKYPRRPRDPHPSTWAQRFLAAMAVDLIKNTPLGARFHKRKAEVSPGTRADA